MGSVASGRSSGIKSWPNKTCRSSESKRLGANLGTVVVVVCEGGAGHV